MPSSTAPASSRPPRSSQRILLTGGRAPATLELARLCARSGHHVFVAESFPSHLCRYSNAVSKCFAIPGPNEDSEGFVHALLDVLANHQIDLLIPTCEEVFHVASHLDRLSRCCRVFCEDLVVLERLHNKYTFVELVRNLGLPAPRSLLLPASDDRLAALSAWLDSQRLNGFVVKPVYGRFGTDVQRFRDGLTSRSRLPRFDDRLWIAQELVSGTPFCTYSVADNGELTSHATYPVQFTAGGSAISFQSVRHTEMERWVADFVRYLNYTGQLGIDFLQDADGRLLPLDCNPRVTSGIHLFDDASDFADVFLGNHQRTLHPTSKRTRCVRAAVPLFGLSDVRTLADACHWLRTVSFGRDVIFRWSDPLPSIHQFVALARFAWRSRLHRTSLIEATTHDIEWNGTQDC